jgi:hypothetical protein
MQMTQAFLRFAQVVPENFTPQAHEKVPSLLILHVPPFLQGIDEQGITTKKHKHDLLILLIV